MSKKIKRMAAVLAAAFCVLTSSVMPAYAYVDPTWEESAGAQETEAPADGTAEEPAETEALRRQSRNRLSPRRGTETSGTRSLPA